MADRFRDISGPLGRSSEMGGGCESSWTIDPLGNSSAAQLEICPLPIKFEQITILLYCLYFSERSTSAKQKRKCIWPKSRGRSVHHDTISIMGWQRTISMLLSEQHILGRN